MRDYLNDHQRIQFPDPRNVSPWGPAVQGGNLSPGVLLSAYEQGFFPWYEDPPILWHSPDPRFVIEISRFHIPRRFSRTLRQTLRSGTLRITFDSAFAEVIRSCRTAGDRERGTWITDEVMHAYTEMHVLGYGHSVEVWKGQHLVGGLYGLAVGALFSGESMFSREAGASKFALVTLVGLLHHLKLPLLDCQTYTEYLASFGATHIPRQHYLHYVEELGHRSGAIPRNWHHFEPDACIRGIAEASVMKPAASDELPKD